MRTDPAGAAIAALETCQAIRAAEAVMRERYRDFQDARADVYRLRDKLADQRREAEAAMLAPLAVAS